MNTEEIMDVIDFHIHISERRHYTEEVHEALIKINRELYYESWEVMEPGALAKYLKEQGVRYAVLLAQSSPATGIVVPNEYVSDFSKKNEMFIPFASINPYTDINPAQTLERCVKELGFKGLKLYPPYQHFYPNDISLYPVYAKAEALGIPVMIHTGSSTFRGARIKYGNPIFIDDVAIDFPNLTIIQVHSGRGFWYKEAFFMARLHDNVFMEVAGLPPQNLLNYFPDLERMADKLIFGSDWPSLSGKGIRANIETIMSLPISYTTKEKILYKNAERILFKRNT